MRLILTMLSMVLLFGHIDAQEQQIRIIHTNDIGGVLVDQGSGNGLAARITGAKHLSQGIPHLIVDAGSHPLPIGAEVEFQLNYSALVRAITSPFVAKVVKVESSDTLVPAAHVLH